ncbi:S4 domain-containing protein YaaA [Tepidibacillus infernus]|nr:S4 domain-containing protein YaaA [Tepidibacillus decaturensis]
MMNEVLIDTEYITLGQFLKMVDVIQSGGHAKIFLMEHQVKVNGEKETRRGRKLHPDDIISIEQIGKFQIKYSS